MPSHLLPESSPFHNIMSAVPCIGFDVLADKICSVHSNIHPQHASSVAAVLATTQLTMTQTTSDADGNADVDADNDDVTQTTEDDADDRRQRK